MKKGFTLIELLVVIAIIGILASVVLVSFPGAQDKARDSRIISAIAQGRTVMTYEDANEGDYNDWDGDCTVTAGTCTCTNVADMLALCQEVADNGGTLTMVGFDGADAGSDMEAACMYSVLNTGAYYCADSTGIAREVTSDPGDATTGTCGGGADDGTCP